MTLIKSCMADAQDDRLARYVSNVVELQGKLATIATHHREMFEALDRMARALREIRETYRN